MTDTALIAYLPEDGSWCKQDFPHMTLVHCGDISALKPTDLNTIGKDAISAARITGPFSLPVTSVEEWGEDELVDVLVLYPTPQLMLARKIVERWESKFKDFKPHATIGPAGSAFSDSIPYYDQGSDVSESRYRMMKRSTLPDRLYFNRIAVCWGDKKMVFNTNSF